MQKLKYLMGLSCALLAGCANTGNKYHVAQNSAQYSTIRGYGNMNLNSMKVARISKIDDQEVGTLWSANSKIKLAPGSHVINAYVGFAKGLFATGVSDEFNLKFIAKPGQDYVVQCELKNNRIFAWITNNSGQPVTAKQSKETLPAGASMVHVNQMKK